MCATIYRIGMLRIPRPKYYLTGATQRPQVDAAFGYDEFARAAEETFRQSYDTMPTCNRMEFAAFFSRRNYEALFREIAKQAGWQKPDATDLLEAMFRAFSMVSPRSDETDPRRTKFTQAAVASYVAECNAKVLDDMVPEVKAGWDLERHFRTHRWGPGEDFAKEQELHTGIDTRTRLNACMYDMTYLLPE